MWFTPNFLTFFHVFLKKYIPKKYVSKKTWWLFLVYQFWVLNSYFSYNSFHFPFKEVVYILFFGISKLLFEVGVWWETRLGPFSFPSSHEEPPSYPYKKWSNHIAIGQTLTVLNMMINSFLQHPGIQIQLQRFPNIEGVFEDIGPVLIQRIII
jgi:hypothetical protein